MKAFEGKQQNDFMEIIEDGHGRKAAIIASQLAGNKLFGVLGNNIIADTVLDRTVYSSYRVDQKVLVSEKSNKITTQSHEIVNMT